MGNMITPQQSGQQLLDDIDSTRVEHGQVAIWWLGQSGYAIKTASALLYFDLYLSEVLTAKYAATEKPHIRMTEAPLRGHEIINADFVFASHKHSDHLDPGTLPDLMQASPQARLILPSALVDHAVALGLPADRLIPTRGEETLSLGTLTVHSLPSAHPDFDYTQEGGYSFLGFVVEADGVTFYHSGDTLAYDGLAERLRRFDIDIAFLPINGTSDRLRELQVPPNMNAAEAIALAQAFRPALVIPHHYDMFTFNTVDVQEFVTQIEPTGQPYRVLQCGERLIYPENNR